MQQKRIQVVQLQCFESSPQKGPVKPHRQAQRLNCPAYGKSSSTQRPPFKQSLGEHGNGYLHIVETLGK